MGLLFGLFLLLMIAGGLAFAAVAALLWLPFMLLRVVLKLVVGLLVIPIVIGAMLFAFVMAGAAIVFGLLLPLAPFALVALVIWALTRHSRAATVIPG
jgi:hypothetical protein